MKNRFAIMTEDGYVICYCDSLADAQGKAESLRAGVGKRQTRSEMPRACWVSDREYSGAQVPCGQVEAWPHQC